VQSAIGLRAIVPKAIVPKVVVRKAIVLEDIFAGAAIFRGRTLRVGCILSSTQSGVSLRRGPRVVIVSITDLKKRFHDRSIGIAAAVGTGALELVLCLWRGVRVVLATVDQIDFTRSKLP
jgi:hypothetical protein